MFIADLFAAFVPVIPFALLAISDARLVSVLVTALLLVTLGIGRGFIGMEPYPHDTRDAHGGRCGSRGWHHYREDHCLGGSPQFTRRF